MILILTEEKDISTVNVLRWLRRMKEPFILLNENSRIELTHLSLNENIKFCLNIDGVCINEADLKSFWYRKYEVNQSFYTDPINNKASRTELEELINTYKFKEEEALLDAFHYYLKYKIRSIGGLEDTRLNNLMSLKMILI